MNTEEHLELHLGLIRVVSVLSLSGDNSSGFREKIDDLIHEHHKLWGKTIGRETYVPVLNLAELETEVYNDVKSKMNYN